MKNDLKIIWLIFNWLLISIINQKLTVKQLGSCSADSQCASGLVCYNSQCRGKFIMSSFFWHAYNKHQAYLHLFFGGDVKGKRVKGAY